MRRRQMATGSVERQCPVAAMASEMRVLRAAIDTCEQKGFQARKAGDDIAGRQFDWLGSLAYQRFRALVEFAREQRAESLQGAAVQLFMIADMLQELDDLIDDKESRYEARRIKSALNFMLHSIRRVLSAAAGIGDDVLVNFWMDPRQDPHDLVQQACAVAAGGELPMCCPTSHAG